MAEIKVDEFVEFLYRRLPNIYRQKDSEQDISLYLFMKSMFSGFDTLDENGAILSHTNGAGETLINIANAFTTFIDPDKCPNELFPYLFQSFGLEYHGDIETKEPGNIIYYHRKYLRHIGELMRRIGTVSGLRFLVRVLTGYEFEYTYERKIITNEEGKQEYGRFLTINLIVDGTGAEEHLEHSKLVIEQFLKPFVPFYINVSVGESKYYQSIKLDRYGNVATHTYSMDYYLKEERDDR